ncbi:hypothetical protein EV368DRAFT_40257 [Lentinula lateritia]|uniref:Uncharacterized protein n=1 Tax=Lentinula aff. lateritia TaxID=2804960 RepID=A0ACC1TSA6_9AGAR|nr:hypothetical protein F5876DRAFT_47883 [Lentinula aff. lateritia]KAJ3852818.1 hypothetical protein EV368DRAFT_40257 [Lentinula lateritia]
MAFLFSGSTLSILLAGSTIITSVSAVNDWNTPCFDGTCEYSLTALPGQNGSGTMQIWGSSNAISDITTAAGWEILNCSATAMAQDIRLVCMSSDTEGAGCDHLFQAGGAEGKLVRLPEDCGLSPFVRVAQSYVSGDQSIPAGISARFVRRDGENGTGSGNSSLPQVQGLSLDTNFSAIDPSRYGNIDIAIQGANFAGADVNGTLVSTATARRRSGLRYNVSARDLSDFVGNAIDFIFIIFLVALLNILPSHSPAIKSLSSFNTTKTISLPPVSVDKSATLLNKDIKCGNVDINVDLGVDGKAQAQISLGVAAQGTIVPPDLSDFAVTVGMDAVIDGTVDLSAGVSTTFDTGKIQVVPPLGIPGLDFPGILTIGPSFEVQAEATAKLDIAADLKVGIVYNISNAQLVFPDKNNQSGGNFGVGDTPLTLSVTPSVKSTGSLTAHLIPSLNLGIQALDNIASATVFLDLDASATMQLSLDAVDSASVSVDNGESSSNSTTSTSNSTSIASSTSSTISAYYSISSTTTTTSSTGLQFGGCVEIDTGLAVNAGADAKFFDLFDASTQVPLFSKEFVLFKVNTELMFIINL